MPRRALTFDRVSMLMGWASKPTGCVPWVPAKDPRDAARGLVSNLLLLLADEDGGQDGGRRAAADGADVADVALGALEADDLDGVGRGHLGERCAADVGEAGAGDVRLLDLAVERWTAAADAAGDLDG